MPGLFDDATNGYLDPSIFGGADLPQPQAVQPAVSGWWDKMVSGGYVKDFLSNLAQSYDPNRSFAQNALDPTLLEHATDLALGFSGGGMATRGVVHDPAFIEQLRASHVGRDDPLPLAGARAEISPPQHIQTMDDFSALVGRNADLVQGGWLARPWYRESGEAIHSHTGGDVPLSEAVAGGASATSPGTDVASNATHAVTLHNQAMAGDPLYAGRFPNDMGAKVAEHYYGGEVPSGGIKTGPFLNAIGSDVWRSPEDILASPNPHTFVNDIWNMRAAEFPGQGGGIYTRPLEPGQKLYDGTPSLGQHNFTRIVNTATRDEVARRLGITGPLAPEEIQAPSWTGIKSLVEGTSPEVAGMSFQQGLRSNYGQGSWESAPGTTTGHLQEYFDAPPEVQQEYHDAIKRVLLDDQGRDILALHHGLLTGPAFDAPGAFQGRVSPGTQSQYALGQAPGGWQQGIDPASKKLAGATEVTRALLLGQDAAAYSKPTYMGGPGLTGKRGVAQANMVNADIGRTLTRDEAAGLYQDMTSRMTQAGADVPDFFSPVGTPNGFRFLNVPEATGISNERFQQIAKDAIRNMPGEGEAHSVDAHFDGDYIPNDWQENPGGEAYRSWLRATGSPDIQRRAEELLAVLGPKVAQAQEDFVRRYGWTPNRATRFWDTDPAIQARQGAVVPSAPRPWENPPEVWNPPRPPKQPKGLLTPDE